MALFMFIITLIGGNFPLLIPFFESFVGFNDFVMVQFIAARQFVEGDVQPSQSANYKDVLYNVENSDAKKLQYSIVYVLLFSYLLAGVLYLIAACQFFYFARRK